LLRFTPSTSKWVLYNRSTPVEGEYATDVAIVSGKIAVCLNKKTGPGSAREIGTFLFDPKTEKWRELSVSTAWSLTAEEDMLWAGIFAKAGVHWWNLRTGDKGQYRVADGLLHDAVSAIAVDVDNDRLWFAMHGDHDKTTDDFHGGGVSVLNRKTGCWESFGEEAGLARSYCCDIAADGTNIWVVHWGEERGLSCYDIASRKWSKILKSANGVELGGVKIATEGDNIWIGQQQGLVQLDRHSHMAMCYTEKDGLPGYIVSGIAINEHGVWVGVYGYGGETRAGIVDFPRGRKVEQAFGS